MSTDSILLSAHQLSVDLCGKRIIDSIDLQLKPQELLILVGPNASGKSTALRTLAGLIKASGGEVRLQGERLQDIEPLQRAKQLAYLPQTFRSQWDLEVSELIALGASRGRGYQLPEAVPDSIDELVASLDLQNLLNRRLSQLSGGEHARAALAWALAANSSILLADEPTAALDIGHQLGLMHYLQGHRSTCSILLVMHDLNLTMRFADRIAVLSGGKLLAIGTPAYIRETGALESAFATEFQWLETPSGVYPIAR